MRIGALKESYAADQALFDTSTQRSWLDAHNLLSVTALPFHLIVTYSGFLFFTYQFMPSVPNLVYEGGSRSAGGQFYQGVYPYPQPKLPAAAP